MRSLTPTPPAMRTTVWVVGLLLLLPGQGFNCCACLKAMAGLGGDDVALNNCCQTATATSHLHLSASHGRKHCPCQCRHQAPQSAAFSSACENRPADDIDYAVRLGACCQQFCGDLPAQNILAVRHDVGRAVPALARCATLSRFLL